jgi:NADPH2:quinone reductase
MKVFVLEKPGKADSFKLIDLEDPKPGKGEVLIKQTAIGVNFFDIHFRRGDYKVSKFPAVLGMEACGRVEQVGPDVTDYKAGDRVCYATGPIGAYAEKRVINQRFLIIPPENLTDTQIAGSILKGLMAHTLLFRVHLAFKTRRILIHSATGGVGQFLVTWAKNLGLQVIGTVGSDAKVNIAKALGCDHVINYAKEDFLKKVAEITNNEGVGAVYDGVGKDTILKSIDSLWPMGICISYGESSGPIPPVDLNHLVPNSLYLTRPLLALYKSQRPELVMAASEVFSKISSGVLKPAITTYKFTDLAKAHQKLESRTSSGSIVLMV